MAEAVLTAPSADAATTLLSAALQPHALLAESQGVGSFGGPVILLVGVLQALCTARF